jgi:hypothetical protein
VGPRNLGSDIEAETKALLLAPDVAAGEWLEQPRHRGGGYGRPVIANGQHKPAVCGGLDAHRFAFGAVCQGIAYKIRK